MAELMKDMYNQESLRRLALGIHSVHSSFRVDEFLESTMDKTWNELELNDRTRKISVTLGHYLPTDYREAIYVLDKVVANHANEFMGVVFPEFVEEYGQDKINWDISIGALERYTLYSSSESAVRPFIINNEGRMMQQMYEWSKHENEHVRRLASEGCRPQLPWAQSLPKFKQDPSLILPILEQLKTDPSPYVRKSVANNLNDISKTHPDLVTKLAKDWYGENEFTNWIVKHGCRTLLKKGNRDVLAIFGYHDSIAIDVTNFAQSTTSISIGDDITFSFTVYVKEPTKIRLEYGVDYVKSNGKRNRKIFQISEVSMKENEKKAYIKKHSFADLSTRKHYPGTHSITIIVNGVSRGTLDVTLNASEK